MADPYASNLQSIDHAMPMTNLLPPIAEVHDVSHERGVVERRPESQHPNAQPLGHGRERVLAVPGLLCSTRHLEGHALPLRPRTEQWQTSAKLPCRQMGRLCRAWQSGQYSAGMQWHGRASVYAGVVSDGPCLPNTFAAPAGVINLLPPSMLNSVLLPEVIPSCAISRDMCATLRACGRFNTAAHR